MASSYNCNVEINYEDVAWYDFSLSIISSFASEYDLRDSDRTAYMPYIDDTSFYADTIDDYLAFFKTDIIRYYAKDNFEKFIIGEGFKKIIKDRMICYVNNDVEVKLYYDTTQSVLKIEMINQDSIYDKSYASIEPVQTILALKSFMKENMNTKFMI